MLAAEEYADLLDQVRLVVNDSRSFDETFSLKVLEPDGGKAHYYTYARSQYGSRDFVEHEVAPVDIMASGDDSEDEDELLTKAQRLEKKGTRA